MDETMFGDGRPGKKDWRAEEEKGIVFRIYQRNGKVLTFPVPSRATETLHPIIKEYTKPGSLYLLYTDDLHAYDLHAYVSLFVKDKNMLLSTKKKVFTRVESS